MDPSLKKRIIGLAALAIALAAGCRRDLPAPRVEPTPTQRVSSATAPVPLAHHAALHRIPHASASFTTNTP
jgi:hypothetical protein